MLLGPSSCLNFRFQTYCKFVFQPRILRHLTTITGDKRLKTIDDLPGPRSYYGFGIGIKILLGKVLTRKPLGKLALEQQLNDAGRYGPIFKSELPDMPLVNLSDPIEIAKVFRSESKYPKRFDIPLLDYYRELRKTIPGVFFANGEDWYRYRSTVSKRILKPREVAEYAPAFNDIITDFITRVDAIKIPTGDPREHEIKDIDNELFKWSFESVTHVLFDRRFGCLGQEMNPEAQDFIISVGKFLYSFTPLVLVPISFHKIYETKIFKDFVFHFDNMYKWAERFIDEKVKELEVKGQANENSSEKVGFMEYLLSKEELSKDDLMASIIDLLFAGVDTTSNTMQWILYMMAKNQDKQEKLYEEISLALQPGEQPTVQTLSKMPYLKACLKETLRLYPVLSVTTRKIPIDMEICGYNLSEGTTVQFLHYFMGRSEKYFQEASKFIPDRWLRSEKRGVSESDQAFASIPFGFGTRMCAGRRIAELEIYLLVTRLLQKYKVTYPENEVVEPFLRGVTIPDRPVRVKFNERI